MYVGFYTRAPTTVDAGIEVVQAAAVRAGLEPGRIINMAEYLAGGPAMFAHPGQVITTILPNGSMVVTKFGQVIGWMAL